MRCARTECLRLSGRLRADVMVSKIEEKVLKWESTFCVLFLFDFLFLLIL